MTKTTACQLPAQGWWRKLSMDEFRQEIERLMELELDPEYIEFTHDVYVSDVRLVPQASNAAPLAGPARIVLPRVWRLTSETPLGHGICIGDAGLVEGVGDALQLCALRLGTETVACYRQLPPGVVLRPKR
jgi:hypothetical protein